MDDKLESDVEHKLRNDEIAEREEEIFLLISVGDKDTFDPKEEFSMIREIMKMRI